MTEEKTIAELLQEAIDKRQAQLTPEQQEKNRKSGEEFFQAVSNVWNNKVPTPWAVNAIENTKEVEAMTEAVTEAFAEGALSSSLNSGPRAGLTDKKKMKRMTAEELAKEIADRWEQAFADFTEEEEKK